MINCKDGNISYEGYPIVLLSELGVIISSLSESLLEKGIYKDLEEIKAQMEYVVEIALKDIEDAEDSEEETEDLEDSSMEELEKISEILDKLIALSKK